MLVSRYTLVYGLLGAMLIVLAFSRYIDNAGYQRTDEALTRALVTYGIARTLNGVISVAQGTQVAIEPAGVGVILTPGQILDPVNDLIERFSWVLLASSASLGIVNVLLAVSAWVWVSVFMSLGLAVLLYLSFRGARPVTMRMMDYMLRLTTVLVILRFAAPVMAIVNDYIYMQFLEPGYESAILELQHTSENINAINRQQAAEATVEDKDRSLLEQARALYESTAQSIKHKIDMEARMEQLSATASKVSRATIDLIVIFLFQTILLPLLFLWLLWYLLRWVIFGTNAAAAAG